MQQWNANTEKLRCLIVLDDSIAVLVSPRAGPAYFRAFIVENRATGEIRLRFRYRYINPEERQSFAVKTDRRGDEAVQYLRSGIEEVLRLASQVMDIPMGENAIMAFYPPDDKGDFESTLVWLEMHDLIEIVRIEETKGDGV